MIKIESSSNDVYKKTKKLLSRQERKKKNLFIAEGERLVRDAYLKGAKIEYIIVNETFKKTLFDDVKTYEMSDKLFDTLKSTVNSQGVIAVISYMDKDTGNINFKDGCYLYLDNISDPGNMGTILRSADAFGVDGVIISPGCVDVYSPKVIRSTMSGIFDVDLYFADLSILEDFKKNGFSVIGTFPDTTELSYSCDYTDKCVIVMGNEANGISDEVAKMCDKKVKIPMTINAESLNVSIACGIILYERFIQKDKKGKLQNG